MATQFTLKLTEDGVRNLMTNGAEKTFKFFTIGDMNTRYDVTAQNTYITELMNITGSKLPFTMRKSCGDAIMTAAEVHPKTPEETERSSQQIKYSFYKEECSTGDFSKQNLDVTVNLHEWFAYLEGLVSVDYSQNTPSSLTIFEGIDSVVEKLDIVNNLWYRVDSTEKFTSWFDFVSSVDRENYLKLSSRYILESKGTYTQVDKSFDRFYSPLVFGFGSRIVGNNYIEGSPMTLTLHPPHFGYVVDGNTTFVELNDLQEPSKYKSITPAVKINNNVNGIYYLKEIKDYRTTDINGFSASMIWGYTNRVGQSLVSGLIELLKNSIEFNYNETSLGVYELPVSLKLNTNLVGGKIVGGRLNIVFKYDTNVTPTGLYNDIVTTN